MNETETTWDDDPGFGLAEAQIAAIEEAFAERDRTLAAIRREVAELTARLPAGTDAPDTDIAARLAAIETRLDGQENALRHILERLIAFFEADNPGAY